MEIVFKGPTFYCQEDEEHFFNWLYSIPAFKEIVGQGFELHLSLKEEVDQKSLEQLIVIFKRWEVETKALLSLKELALKSSLPWVQNAIK
jgi:hypothetical protein